MKKIKKNRKLNKKIAMGLGAITTVGASAIPVLACGEKENKTKENDKFEDISIPTIEGDFATPDIAPIMVDGDFATDDYDVKVKSITAEQLNEVISIEPNQLASEVESIKAGTIGDVEYVFEIKDSNDDNGTLNWSATLTYEKAKGTITGTKTGYTTKEDKELVGAVTAEELNGIIDDDKSKMASEVSLTSGDTDSGVHYEFKVIKTDDEQGVITWEATLTKGNATKKINGTKTGYQPSSIRINKELVDAVTEKEINDHIKTEKNKLPSDVEPFADGETDKGVNYTLHIDQGGRDDTKGTIAWTAILTKGDATKVISGVKTGYDTQSDKEAVEAVTVDELNNLIEDLPKYAATQINSLGEGVTTSGVHYKFTINSQNYSNGVINWTAVLTKGNETKVISGDKTGYQTDLDREIENAMNSVTENELNGHIQADPNKLPSQIDGLLGKGITTHGVYFEITINSRDDFNGVINWTAKLTLNGREKLLSGTKTGYASTQDKQNENYVNKVTVDTINDLIKNEPDKLPSEVSLTGGDTVSGVHYEFKTTKANDKTGKISWTVTLTKGNITKELSGTKTGYLTKEKLADRTDVAAVTVDEINNLIDLDLSKLPSDIESLPSKDTKSGVHIDFVITDRNDDGGTISWTAKLSKGEATGELEGIKRGYLNKSAKANIDAVNAVVPDDLKLPHGVDYKLPSDPEFNQPENGVTENGVKYVYTQWTRDDSTGTITWKVSLEKGAAYREMSGTITGFKHY